MRPAKLETVTLWRGRSRREKILLAAFAILVALFSVWYGVASPLRRAATAANAERSRAGEQLAMVATALRELAGAQGSLPLPAGGIEAAVTVSAAASGIAIKRTRVEGVGEITIWTESIDPKTFFAWIRTLQKSRGVVVVDLTAMRDEGGALNVEARFAGGSG